MSVNERPIAIERRRRPKFIVGVLAVALLLAGGTAAYAALAGDIVHKMQAQVQKGYSGLQKAPTGGAPAQRGKTVYVVDCGFVAVGCHAPSEAVKAAATPLGWKVVQVDGKLNPAGYIAGINQAIAANPDGIITIGISCSEAKSAYQAAKSKKIPTVGIYNFDCNDPKVNAGPKLMTAQIDIGKGQNPGAWFREWGSYHAAYIIARTRGKARVIEFAQKPWINTIYSQEGFEAAMKKCATCKIIAKQELNPADLGPAQTGAQKIAAMIRKYPQANAMFFDNDTLLQQAAQTLRSNKQTRRWVIVGAEGYPTTFQMVRDGTVDALVAWSPEWFGWCAAWNLNEIFAGKTPSWCGAGLQLVDKTHNLPATGKGLQPRVNFKAAMKKVWAGG